MSIGVIIFIIINEDEEEEIKLERIRIVVTRLKRLRKGGLKEKRVLAYYEDQEKTGLAPLKYDRARRSLSVGRGIYKKRFVCCKSL